MCGKDLRDVLNKIFWDKRLNVKDYVLTYTHRGAKENKKTVPCGLIVKIGKSWFTYKDKETDSETFIPYHRVLEVKNIKTGKVLWRKTSISEKNLRKTLKHLFWLRG